ncbi:ARHGEF16 isoform 6, partial [Pongo abelii]
VFASDLLRAFDCCPGAGSSGLLPQLGPRQLLACTVNSLGNHGYLGFFEDLEQRHKAQVLVEDISDILEEHAEKHFHPYIAYCSNEVYQQRTLQKLISSNAAFREVLREIERRPACGGLPMLSFLILPMQRVTRLPLLTDTLCLKTQGHSERYKAANRALKAISKLVRQCNEGAHRMERME